MHQLRSRSPDEVRLSVADDVHSVVVDADCAHSQATAPSQVEAVVVPGPNLATCPPETADALRSQRMDSNAFMDLHALLGAIPDLARWTDDDVERFVALAAYAPDVLPEELGALPGVVRFTGVDTDWRHTHGSEMLRGLRERRRAVAAADWRRMVLDAGFPFVEDDGTTTYP